MKRKGKLYRNSGFTLAETLLAVLILLMVSTIVATGVPVAKNAYEKVVLGSNAQVLLSNAISALRYELGTARDISIDGTTVTYISADTGAQSRLSINGTEGIWLEEYYNVDLSDDKKPKRRLVSKAAGGTGGAEEVKDNIYVKYKSVERDRKIITFKDIEVFHNTDASVIASFPEYTIRVIGTFEEPSS